MIVGSVRGRREEVGFVMVGSVRGSREEQIRSVRVSDWAGYKPIFLSNLPLASWENSDLPPTYQSLNLVDWLQILVVLTRQVRQVGINKCYFLKKNYHNLKFNIA